MGRDESRQPPLPTMQKFILPLVYFLPVCSKPSCNQQPGSYWWKCRRR